MSAVLSDFQGSVFPPGALVRARGRDGTGSVPLLILIICFQ